MTDLTNVGLICPVCREPLDISNDQVNCNSCDRVWPVEGGVPRFISNAPYWGELSEEKMILLFSRSFGTLRYRVRPRTSAIKSRVHETAL